MFYIGENERKQIADAIAAARAKPLSWGLAKEAMAAHQETDRLMLVDRPPTKIDRHPQQVMIPVGYRLAISCEEQPAGMCLHLSMSSPRSAAGKVPAPEACKIVAEVAGLPWPCDRHWLEEFEPGEMAINLLWVIEPRDSEAVRKAMTMFESGLARRRAANPRKDN